MSLQIEQKILEKLDKIEDLLIQVVPQKTELTEEDALEIIEEGRQEYKEGKLTDFDDFVKREYSQYAKKNKSKAVQSV